MATVGQQLPAPEAGWKRYGNADQNFVYSGNWRIVTADSYYGGSQHGTVNSNSKIAFKFSGTKLRIITDSNTDHTSNAQIKIDGEVSNFSICDISSGQRFSFEKTGLASQVHIVEIINLEDKGFGFSAIDIDETGELLPYNSDIKSTSELLRVTMLDSSERDYQLSTTEIDGFINWYMKHTSTDTTGYMLTKKVGTEVSKEYLTLDKVISFEVIER